MDECAVYILYIKKMIHVAFFTTVFKLNLHVSKIELLKWCHILCSCQTLWFHFCLLSLISAEVTDIGIWALEQELPLNILVLCLVQWTWLQAKALDFILSTDTEGSARFSGERNANLNQEPVRGFVMFFVGPFSFRRTWWSLQDVKLPSSSAHSPSPPPLRLSHQNAPNEWENWASGILCLHLPWLQTWGWYESLWCGSQSDMLSFHTSCSGG